MSAMMSVYLSATVIGLAIVMSILLAKGLCKYRHRFTPGKCMILGLFLGAVILFMPIYISKFSDMKLNWFQTIVASMHNALRLFILDGDFEIVISYTRALPSLHQTPYVTLFSILYILCPICTFNFVISYFENVSAHRRLICGYLSDLYIFSELNEASVALAADIRKKNRKCLLVFTDVFSKNDEYNYELRQKARDLNAICFKKDILNINWKIHSKSSNVYLLIIGSDESENIKHAVKLSKLYNKQKNFRLSIFSTSAESKLLFSTIPYEGMKIRRINVIRSLVNNALYEKGYGLFEDARQIERDEKLISIALVGLGKIGQEMLKSLVWFCQMDGYRVEIDAFDKNINSESMFAALCPELMSPSRNGVYEDGEAQYHIRIHSGLDVNTSEFHSCFQRYQPFTYIFVALGDDAENVAASVYLRMISARMKNRPRIETVIYDVEKIKSLERVTDYRGNDYCISYIGGLDALYAENAVADSDLEMLALERHLKYGTEHDFWAHEYNYQSSIATAIHMKMRMLCGIPGAEKEEELLTVDEKYNLEILEHRRWNAYMRSEGYVFSGSTDKESRDDIAKMHHDLVPFTCLDEEEKEKDAKVATK